MEPPAATMLGHEGVEGESEADHIVSGQWHGGSVGDAGREGQRLLTV